MITAASQSINTLQNPSQAILLLITWRLGAIVITNILSAIPYIGIALVQCDWGGFAVDNATLNQFLTFHILLSFKYWWNIQLNTMIEKKAITFHERLFELLDIDFWNTYDNITRTLKLRKLSCENFLTMSVNFTSTQNTTN